MPEKEPLQVGDDVEDRAPNPDCETCEGKGTVEGGLPCPDCMAGGPSENAAQEDLEARLSPAERLKGTVERRSCSVDGAEIRSTTDGGLRFSGYASMTERSYKVGKFEETFARGAFKRTLNESPDVVLLINHGEGGSGLPIARTSSGTLTLSEDARGLKVDADLDPADPDVQALEPKMRRGDLNEMSFAFKATDDEWSDRDTKRLVRSATIHRGDVSIVTRGANSATTASLRELVGAFEERQGKTNSAADRAEIEEAITKLQNLLRPEDEAKAASEQTARDDALKVTVQRMEIVKARRARLRSSR